MFIRKITILLAIIFVFLIPTRLMALYGNDNMNFKSQDNNHDFSLDINSSDNVFIDKFDTGPSAKTLDNFVVTESLMTDISSDEFYDEYDDCKTPPEKTIFYDTDTRATLWFHYENANAGDTLKIEWYSPDETLFGIWNSTYSYVNGCWYSFIYIKGYSAASKLGDWQVKVYRNDSLLFTENFTIQKDTTVQFSVVEHLMTYISQDEFHGEYKGCKTPPNKSTFLDTDTQAALWFNYENATIGDTHKSEWYAPDGNLYAQGSGTYSYNNGCRFRYINIKGASAASKLGDWQVKVYRNDSLLFTENFTIQKDTIVTTPTPKASPTPTPTTTPGEEDLLGKYAPILYMHSEERFHPTNAEVMLENSELYIKTCKNEACKKYKGEQVKETKNKTLTTDLLMDDYNDDSYYLQLKKKASKKAKKEKWKERQTVYARQTTDTDEDGNEKTILQYWFFYVYNDWGTKFKFGNSHEGDWEMIQIELGEDKEPERISFSYHHGGVTFGWDDKDEDNKDKVIKNGKHPHVYVTLGGHGCWNSPGNHIWYQEVEKYGRTNCFECIDETNNEGDVLYPETMTESEISEIESSAKKYSYAIKDMKDTDWIYWKGYWGLQTNDKLNGKDDYGSSGPPSPPYIDYIEGDDVKGRWEKPVQWADNPRPSTYTLCNSDNSKVVIHYLGINANKFSDYCNRGDNAVCDNVCSNLRIIYSEEDLVFDVYSLDGEEVNLKISRYKRTTGEVCDVEFDWLEIPKNGKATLRFSPEQNPNLEMEIDHDQDGISDYRVSPDYVTQNP